MTQSDLPHELKSTARLYALQCVVAALCVRVLEHERDFDGAAREIMDDAFGAAARFRFRGVLDRETEHRLHLLMEDIATETVMAAVHTVKARHPQGRPAE